MQPTLSESLERVVAGFENRKWVKCPICQEERTKLRPCFFKNRGKGGWTNVCVECAESLKSIKQIVNRYPVEKPFENWPDEWLSIVLSDPVIHKGVSFPRTIQVTIKVYPGDISEESIVFHWRLHSESMRIVIFDKKENMRVETLENIFQAWMWCREKIEDWFGKLKSSQSMKKDIWEFHKFRCFLVI